MDNLDFGLDEFLPPPESQKVSWNWDYPKRDDPDPKLLKEVNQKLYELKQKINKYEDTLVEKVVEKVDEIELEKGVTRKCISCGRFFYPAKGFYDITYFCSGRCKQRTYRENKKLFRELPTPDSNNLSLDQTLAQLMEEDPCYYCGLIADIIDHTVPQSLLKRMFEYENELPPGIKTMTVRACTECNSTLGGKIFNNLTDRMNYIKKRLREKNKRLLSMPFWNENELAELGPNLRRSVEASLAQKRVIQYRLRWPNI